jgi:signal transduction histidine kinase
MMKDRSLGEYKSALNSVLEDIRSLIYLSNRLLLIARTSAEGPSNFSSKVRIDEILWQAKEEVNRFNPRYHINMQMDDSLTDSNQMTVTGDENLLKVAVLNLIENACKYSSDNKVNIKIAHSEKRIEVLFEDHGIGIPEADLEKITEPFYRGANALSKPGSGIGLSLVNQIVKNHNGSMLITSAVGKGTTVSLILPSV